MWIRFIGYLKAKLSSHSVFPLGYTSVGWKKHDWCELSQSLQKIVLICANTLPVRWSYPDWPISTCFAERNNAWPRRYRPHRIRRKFCISCLPVNWLPKICMKINRYHHGKLRPGSGSPLNSTIDYLRTIHRIHNWYIYFGILMKLISFFFGNITYHIHHWQHAQTIESASPSKSVEYTGASIGSEECVICSTGNYKYELPPATSKIFWIQTFARSRIIL
jgi:hypothetical protein